MSALKTSLILALSAALAAPLCASAAAPPLFSASNLVGARIVDARGAAVGELRDLAIDVSRATVAYAIVDFHGAGVQNVGLRSVPLDAFRSGLARGKLSLDPSQYLDWNSQIRTRPFAEVLRASTLLGMEVDRANGRDYGTLRDVLLEFPGGRVREADLAPARANAPVREVPFAALRFPRTANAAVLARLP